jgi:NAD(P)-dependent dehydrogenase (short-subunit alcohol dehydrogenase family)
VALCGKASPHARGCRILIRSIEEARMGELDGKVAIVTGASSGIGAGVAEAMADAGARTVASGRDAARLGAVVARIESAGGECRSAVLDLEQPGACQSLVDRTLEAFGSIDSIVHGAGVFWPKPFPETTMEDYDRQMGLNVRVPFELTKLALPHLREGASIIYVSSIAGYIGFPNSSAYCASKGAVELLTRALGVELAPQGIRVNCIAPGNVATPMNAHLLADPDYYKSMIDATPSRSIGKVEEIAPMAVFLASDKASFMVGSSVLIDGGWCAA